MDIESIKGRATDVRDRIPEVRERIDAWREDLELPSARTAETVAGAVLVGAGIVATIVNLLGNKRDFWAWVLPSVLLSGGIALLVAALFEWRGDRIDAAEEQLSRLGASPGSAGA